MVGILANVYVQKRFAHIALLDTRGNHVHVYCLNAWMKPGPVRHRRPPDIQESGPTFFDIVIF
jgi:hypothetical protein